MLSVLCLTCCQTPAPAGRETTMGPSSYDAFLAREVDEHMADDSDELEVTEQDFYDDDGGDEASDYQLHGCCP